jgi:hypothetical protein
MPSRRLGAHSQERSLASPATLEDAHAVTGLAWLTRLVLTQATGAAVDVFRRRGYG